jgi:potassium efflux system protein
VTRIQMRATTITSWDRKDFIVPNKELVTGTMMNWTLTSPITRVTISVGVAYGTDTTVARAILQEIAEAHPDVLDDPAPFTVFQEFGDSALLLELRVYLGDITRRISTYTAIRETVARRFADAGIEIAFPQRDLNIRSISREARDALEMKQPVITSDS